MKNRSRRSRRLARQTARQSLLRRCSLESLEDRRLLAGDVLPGGPGDEAVQVGLADPDLQAEAEPAVDLVQFAKDLTDAGVVFYGADWCPACNEQKGLFGDGSQFLDFVEVTNADRTRTQLGTSLGITTYPTWEFQAAGGGTFRETGVLSLEELSTLSGVAIPTSEQPSIAPIPDQVVETTSPLHVPIDGYDPDGQPLTITVTSSDPSVVTADLVTGNRSAVITVVDRGEMIVHLFEQRAPAATGRFVELVESDYYNNVPFHRIVGSFVIQAGIGATSRPQFPDDFHPELQHNQPGVISYAKAGDDTNTTQWFITDRATPTLDYNHSVFGQVTEGDDVRASIQRAVTGVQAAPVISGVELIDDMENGLVKLTAQGTSGTATITVRVEDADGRVATEMFEVTVQEDTDNAAPFLLDDHLIRDASGAPQVVTQRDVPVVINLEAFDAESDPVTFNVTRRGTVPYEFSLAGSTLTVTPPANFVGEMEIDVEVEQADGGVFNPGGGFDITDNQTIAIAVTPPSPGTLDLLSQFDSGVSSTDDITSETNPTIRVSGAMPNATVSLRDANGVVVGQLVATSPTVDIPVDLGQLGDGTHQLTARQTFNGQTSVATPELTVTLDTVAPDMGTAPDPSQIDVGSLFSFDADTAEEAGSQFVQYSLSGQPNNMTINTATGVVEWIPTATQRGNVTPELSATDAAGNVSTLTLDVTAGGPVEMHYTLEVRDGSGNVPSGPLVVGDTLLLDVFVEDVTSTPTGVKGAFLDIPLPAGLERNGDATFGPFFTLDVSGASDAAIDEFGASSDASISASGRVLLATIPLEIVDGGDFTLQASPADRDSERYTDGTVSVNEILYGSVDVTAVTPFVANDDERNVDEDAGEQALMVLNNDEFLSGFSGTLSVLLVTSPSKGTARVVGNDVLYTPGADQTGGDTFTYVITDDQQRGTATGTVTIGIQPQNDPPEPQDDEFTVDEDSNDNVLDVLGNDIDLDGDTLEILQISNPPNGTAVASPNDNFILYTPDADFDGTDVFTYTVTDNEGGTATATVTVNLNGSNDPPVAVNDSQTALEDTTVTIDVLANDLTVDSGETLTVTGVTPGAEGGTAVVASNQVVYTPPANFNGPTTLTYTISDGNGGSAQGQINLTFTAENDPPTAVDDPDSGVISIAFNTADNEIDVLANDSDPEGDTLSIQGVSNFSAGGSATVAGGVVLYTPDTDFTGVETFQYTVVDSLGQSSTATVTVTVLEFQASSLSGFVYMDADNDGVFDSNEAPLSGVTVTLNGVDELGAAVSETKVTDASGAYTFQALRAGSYTIEEMQPTYLSDGIDTVGSQGGTLGGNDVIAVELAAGTDGTDNNFGEGGRSAEYRSIRSLFRSTSRRNVFVAVDTATNQIVGTFSEGPWVSPPVTEVTLDPDTGTLTTTVTHDGLTMTTVIDTATTNPIQLVGESGSVRVYRALHRSDFENPTAAGAESEPPTVMSGAEGEPPVLPVDDARVREHFAAVDAIFASDDGSDEPSVF